MEKISKKIVGDALRQRIGVIVRREMSKSQTNEVIEKTLHNAVSVIGEIMQKGKVKNSDLIVLHEAGVFILGLLSKLNGTTPQDAKRLIERRGFLVTNDGQVEVAILESHWFYKY